MFRRALRQVSSIERVNLWHLFSKVRCSTMSGNENLLVSKQQSQEVKDEARIKIKPETAGDESPKQSRISGLGTKETSGFLSRCATARMKINTLWNLSMEENPRYQVEPHSGPSEQALDFSPYTALELFKSLEMDMKITRDEDITRGLGEAVDRLIVLLVKAVAHYLHEKEVNADVQCKLSQEEVFQAIPTMLQSIARNGLSLERRTIQQVFASCYNYGQALSIFEEIKICGMTIDASVYYIMIYCLQRLDEESWGRTFSNERCSMKDISLEAMKFVLHGAPNQLLPDNKPHLGRVMFSDAVDINSTKRACDFDASGKDWHKRWGK